MEPILSLFLWSLLIVTPTPSLTYPLCIGIGPNIILVGVKFIKIMSHPEFGPSNIWRSEIGCYCYPTGLLLAKSFPQNHLIPSCNVIGIGPKGPY